MKRLKRVRFVRQTGNGHFALLVAAAEPAPALSVETDLGPQILPGEFFAAAKAGLEAGLSDQPCAVFILDALYHEVDSRPRDFEWAARLLAKEMTGQFAPEPTKPNLIEVRAFWENRWNACRRRWYSFTQSQLEKLGFQPAENRFERRLGPLLWTYELRPDAPRLPAAVTVQQAVVLPEWSERPVALVRPGLNFQLEEPEVLPDLSPALDWFRQRDQAENLLQHGALEAGPEAVLLMHTGRPRAARARIERELYWLEGKLGWNNARRELTELLARLPQS